MPFYRTSPILNRFYAVLALILPCFFLTGKVAQAGPVKWVSDQSGNWDDASNWSTGSVPANGDTVTIDRPSANVTVTFRTGTVNVAAITCTENFTQTSGTLSIGNTSTFSGTTVISGGTFVATADVVFAGSTTWSGGTIKGPGKITASGSLVFSSANNKFLDTARLELTQNSTWSDGHINGSNGATLVVPSGVTLDVQNNGYGMYQNGGALATLDVQGTVKKTAGANPSLVGFVCNNSGLVEAANGELSLSGGGSGTGVYRSSGAGLLRFSSGTTTIAASGQLVNNATLAVSGGAVIVNGSFTSLGALQVSAGSLQLTASNQQINQLTMQGGTVSWPTVLTINSPMTWSGGTFKSGGRLVVNGSVTFSGGTKVLDTARLELTQNSTWSDGHINGSNGATLVVPSGVTLDVQNNGYGMYQNGGALATLEVQGTVKKTAGANPSIVAFVCNNAGVVEAANGELALGGGGTGTGVYRSSGAGLLRFSSGTTTIAASGQLVNNATLAVSGGTVIVNGSFTSPGILQINSGTFTAAADVVFAGSTTWSGGTIKGPGKITASGSLVFSSASTKTLDTARLELTQNSTWSDGHINGSNGATLVVPSGVTLDVQNNGYGMYQNGGALATLEVQGTVKKTAGANPSIVAFVCNNAGLVEAASGELNLSGGGIGASTGIYRSSGAGLLRFSSGTTTIAASGQLVNNATLAVSGGTVIANGTFTSPGALQVSAGSLQLTASDQQINQLTMQSGTLSWPTLLTVNSPMTWSGGTFKSGGRLVVNGSVTFSGGTKVLDTARLELTQNSTWANGDIYGQNGATLVVPSGVTLDVQNNGYGMYQNGGALATLDVQGTVKKTAGANPSYIGFICNNSGTIQAPNMQFDRLVNRGTFAVPVGNTATVANFTQESTGVTEIEIAGIGTGQSGLVKVTSKAIYDGVLRMKVLSGYNPVIGDSVNVFSSPTRTGEFTVATVGASNGLFEKRIQDQYFGVVVTSGTPNTAPAIPTLITPVSDAVVEGVPTRFEMSSSDAENQPLRFRVDILRNGTVLQTVSQVLVPDNWDKAQYANNEKAVLLAPTALIPGVYQWRAQAYDGRVWGAYSETRNFTYNGNYIQQGVDLLTPSLVRGQGLRYNVRVTAASPLWIKVRSVEQGQPWGFALYRNDGTLVQNFVASGLDFAQTTPSLPPGEYVLDIIPQVSNGKAVVYVAPSLSALTPGTLYVGKIYHNDGNDYLQVDIPEGTTKADFTLEPFGNISRIDVYSGTDFKKPVASGAQSFNPPARATLDSPAAGRYYIAVFDHGQVVGNSQIRDYSVRISLQTTSGTSNGHAKVERVEPAVLGNTGSAKLTIFGENLGADATVQLVDKDGSKFSGTSVQTNQNRTQLVTAFNLDGLRDGRYAIEVTFADSSIQTLPQAVTIQQGGEPVIWADITGRTKIRTNRASIFHVRVGNSGTVNTGSFGLLVSLPLGTKVKFDLPTYQDALISINRPQIEALESSSTPFLLISRGLSPNEITEFDLYLTSTTGQEGDIKLQIARKIQQTRQTTRSQPYPSRNGTFYPADTVPPPGSMAFYYSVPITPGGEELNQRKGTGHVAGVVDGVSVVDLNPVNEGQPVGPGIVAIRDRLRPKSPEDEQRLGQKVVYLGAYLPPSVGVVEGQGIANSLRKQVGLPIDYSVLPYGGVGNCINLVFSAYLATNTHIELPTPLFDLTYTPAQLYEYYSGQPWPGTGAMSAVTSPSQIENGVIEGIISSWVSGVFQFRIASSTVTFVSAVDPNEIVGVVGYGTDRAVSNNAPLSYTVYFENVPTSTAAAQEVTITNQIDPDKFDLSTFALGTMGCGEKVLTPPSGQQQYVGFVDLRPAKELIVRIAAQLDKSTGIATWTYTSLDPTTGELTNDPLLGFLPPNVTDPEGSGSVSYTVSPKPGLVSGTQITNQASIVFDANAPIQTNTWSNTLDTASAVSRAKALPGVIDRSRIPVEWEAEDGMPGSGVQFYNVYVSDNGSPYTRWLTNITDTKADYPAKFGHTYKFVTTTVDNVGNREALRSEPDAITIVGHAPLVTKGLRMVSVPVQSEVLDPLSIFGVPSNLWARFNPEANAYAIFDNDPTGIAHWLNPLLIPGSAYWTRLPGDITPGVSGGLPDDTQPFVISLKKKWNQIANPFLAPLAWTNDTIQVRRGSETKSLSDAHAAGWIEEYLWGWEPAGEEGRYYLVADPSLLPDQINALQPWQGYWMYASEEVDLILAAPFANAPTRGRKTGDSDSSKNWSLRLIAESAQDSDAVTLGVAGKGLEATAAPSPLGSTASGFQIRLRREGRSLSAQIQKSGTARPTWDFEVTVPASSGTGRADDKPRDVILRWPNITRLSRNAQPRLIDTKTGRSIFLRNASSYRFTASSKGGTYPFRLETIPLRGVLAISNVHTAVGRGLNGNRAIAFTLNRSAEVTVRVLTLTGKEVSVIEAGRSREVGESSVIWNGMTSSGTHLPAGTYQVEIRATTADGQQAVQRMPITSVQ